MSIHSCGTDAESWGRRAVPRQQRALDPRQQAASAHALSQAAPAALAAVRAGRILPRESLTFRARLICAPHVAAHALRPAAGTPQACGSTHAQHKHARGQFRQLRLRASARHAGARHAGVRERVSRAPLAHTEAAGPCAFSEKSEVEGRREVRSGTFSPPDFAQLSSPRRKFTQGGPVEPLLAQCAAACAEHTRRRGAQELGQT